MLNLPPVHFTKVDGLRARYVDHGSSGAPLLLLHGIGGSIEAWHRNLAPLAAQRRTLAIDLPGSGRSDRPVPYPQPTLAFFAGYLQRFLVEIGAADGVFVVGSSFGGAVAMELAVRHPQMVRGLVLVSPSGLSTVVAWPLRIASTPLIGELVTRPSRASTARSLRGLVADPTIVTDDEIDAAYTLASLPGAQASFLDLLRIYCNPLGIKRRETTRIIGNLPRITVPTLIVWGEQDTILPFASARPAMQRLPNAQLILMTGCGHMPYVEAPERFNRLLADYVQRVETGAWQGNGNFSQDRLDY
ncbi:MAG: alpha/beta fold hydrolase [Anaerolineales bacterium]|nr:alpha/beta fold hydrolase [Anaerolineales bacterium]